MTMPLHLRGAATKQMAARRRNPSGASLCGSRPRCYSSTMPNIAFLVAPCLPSAEDLRAARPSSPDRLLMIISTMRREENAARGPESARLVHRGWRGLLTFRGSFDSAFGLAQDDGVWVVGRPRAALSRRSRRRSRKAREGVRRATDERSRSEEAIRTTVAAIADRSGRATTRGWRLQIAAGRPSGSGAERARRSGTQSDDSNRCGVQRPRKARVAARTASMNSS